MSHIFPVVISLGWLFLIANSLILAHEFGHYAVARLTGLTARRFALGFGPEIFEWTDRKEAIWSLAIMPMGGYVSFPGEHNANGKNSYLSRPPLLTATQRTWRVILQTFHGIAQALTTGQGAGNFRGIIGVADLAG